MVEAWGKKSTDIVLAIVKSGVFWLNLTDVCFSFKVSAAENF